MSDPVRIFTDGSCLGNPGVGGWSALLLWGERRKELSGAEAHTTNNRMELTAAISALSYLRRPCQVQLATDSQYLKLGICEWLPRWRRRGWRGSAGQRVKNRDLWQSLEAAVERHEVEWLWVPAHSGHPENERADALAKEAARDLLERGATGDGIL
ncbi:MAG: ribonuclease HI [Gammaproteobacteria bacterium]|nr:ribonuclease HI [Gammaproteobacteria bacterium]MDD9823687.1 ribonuclease HI [Gammaproteobacteria bacterium]MDD9864626.1 ribonuclease HI [Gammaproteobacteria bacterium]